MEFLKHQDTKRWFRPIIITEKIDGTNAAIHFEAAPDVWDWDDTPAFNTVEIEGDTGGLYLVGAQSRTRMISPGKQTDNAGFAAWVDANAQALFNALGPGSHYGEWWGQGIQRNYGLKEKRFSLFNTSKWRPSDAYALPELFSHVPGLTVVPVLYEGPNSEQEIKDAANLLNLFGSRAAPGFDRPEGVCIFHIQSNKIFKYTPFEKSDGHKRA